MSVAGSQLRAIVERVERLDEEIKALNADKSAIFSEAKSQGFDVKVLKRVIAYRRKDRSEAEAEEGVFATYLGALGMIPDEGADEAPSRAHAREAA